MLGCVGLIALVGLVYLLVWYWKGRRESSEEMIIERPTQIQNTQDPSTYEVCNPESLCCLVAHSPTCSACLQNTVFSTPIQNFNPPPGTLHAPERTYIPNHPYAKTYARMSAPPTPPLEGATVFETQHPRLSPLTMPHPYTQTSHSGRRERVASPQPSTVYESFMSPESGAATPEPQIEPMEPSPLASTVGGALSHHAAPFDTVLSTTLSEELPSSMSASSSAPLQPDDKQPRR